MRVQSARSTAVSGVRRDFLQDVCPPLARARKRQTRLRSGGVAQLRRAGPGVTLLGFPRPVTSWSATALVWTAPLLGSPHPYPTICRLWIASPLRVVRSPVVFLVATLGGRQSAALPDCSCCGAQRLGKTATWCPQVVSCPQAQAGHVGRLVGRLSHDRTKRHWQRLGSHRKYVMWSQHTRGSPRHVSKGSCCAIIFSPFSSWTSTRLGWGTLFGSTPVPHGAS